MRHNGIHHVTAIAASARRNLDFFTRILGMRLVKKTVNFDDPGGYHFYYGDEAGHPGTILTFFPLEHAAPGRAGIGEAQETRFLVPEASLSFWTHRLVEKGVAHEAPTKLFGETAISFTDPDGTHLALVGVAGAEAAPGWSEDEIPQEHAIRGIHSVKLLLKDAEPTAEVLTDVLGFEAAGTDGSLVRFQARGSAPAMPGTIVDLHAAGEFLRGRMGAGSVHHIAFRADEDGQAEMARRLREVHRIATTEQKDRKYFRSVYFREPGGVLFEIATDDPGFAIDETKTDLGQRLKLPAEYEARRAEIEAVLPELA
ncbi:ring-cleaving dioxygenase [Afifella marina]|uniref:Glyoxalase family protein n=1 Tax=Afifella marina DSM 2698 TaxID=1120955 RepID=A0A1G5MXR9_AFIMA|nr:ring-cleaving dioxygenase [Afifella marina]MBK1622098.1 ring-cleaving dioxygenase [Afifella marina DSM 2698]MBK1627890.1 ring-cleaving dioxygenase [Afifella marina]MBK5918044.1 ring-cleaving dioxygenase [Afifella marina]RAI19822.1 ring-cleaving dioxygenase [Afifella marina DSM 2698]SCZ29448.1 glyoxalase family protein [Afifella marina DSM 2698]